MTNICKSLKNCSCLNELNMKMDLIGDLKKQCKKSQSSLVVERFNRELK